MLQGIGLAGLGTIAGYLGDGNDDNGERPDDTDTADTDDTDDGDPFFEISICTAATTRMTMLNGYPRSNEQLSRRSSISEHRRTTILVSQQTNGNREQSHPGRLRMLGEETELWVRIMSDDVDEGRYFQYLRNE